MPAAKKFYAVRKGRKPGIYGVWKECQAQIMGFPGAVYKSFPTLAEALTYMQPQQTVIDEDHALIAYVDGSYRSDNHRIGYGAVILDGGQEICLNGEVPDRSLASMHNVAGEIKGAEAAMRYAAEQGRDALIIYHDYEGVGAWCTGAWAASKPGTQAYRAFYETIAQSVKVEFRKVKGHSGDHYNDVADALAKKAIES